MTIASINPATGQVLKTFDELSDAAIEAKLGLTAEAFSKHRNVPFVERARMMVKAAEIIEAEKETFGKMMALEKGKPVRAAILTTRNYSARLLPCFEPKTLKMRFGSR